ncbi:MAG: FKBP-type peptidyl-prolyl cis-trans isomerase [Bacteroidales bacterium]
MKNAELSKQKQESEEFLAAKKKEEGVKELNGGVLYKVLKAGEGDKKPAATDSVIVKYEGRLADGTVFDSSEHAPEGTATLNLQYMIEGWKIALPEMTVGSEWELYIPAELGYGERGTGPIPPYSALIFKVTLVGIK